MTFCRPLAALALVVALAGCVGPVPAPPPTSSASRAAPDAGPHGSLEPTPVPSSDAVTSPSDPATTPPRETTEAPATDAPEPLTDFEQALAGTWRRYHVKNSGYSNEYSYYEYVDFNEDRTACRWKYGEESSTSSTDQVFDEGDYPQWRIVEQLAGGGASFSVAVEGRGLDYVFDFGENILYPAGFETLVFVPNTDGKSCVYRGGASY